MHALLKASLPFVNHHISKQVQSPTKTPIALPLKQPMRIDFRTPPRFKC